MTTIPIIKGDATDPGGSGNRVIAHVVNDQGYWGAGFTRCLSDRWPRTEWNYRDWATNFRTVDGAHRFELGNNRYLRIDDDRDNLIWVVHMCAQNGIASQDNRRPIRYDALGACLMQLGQFATLIRGSVHMPKIGAGLARGDWNVIQEIINDALIRNGVETTVYELPARP